MIDQLVIACRELESIYWRQSDPEALALYNALEADKTPRAQNLRRYLFINGSRCDLVDENKPFVGTAPMPPGHALYPAGPHARRDRTLRRRRIPPRRQVVYNPYTSCSRQGHRSGRRAVPQTLRRRSCGRPRRRSARPPISSDDPAFAEVPAPPRRRAAHRRLLHQRHRLARSEGPEVRHHLRALRNLPRRPARREDVLRRVDPDSQRRREPEARGLPEVGSRHPGRAAARRRGSAVGARARRRRWK